jgi:hypothetical protein
VLAFSQSRRVDIALGRAIHLATPWSGVLQAPLGCPGIACGRDGCRTD